MTSVCITVVYTCFCPLILCCLVCTYGPLSANDSPTVTWALTYGYLVFLRQVSYLQSNYQLLHDDCEKKDDIIRHYIQYVPIAYFVVCLSVCLSVRQRYVLYILEVTVVL